MRRAKAAAPESSGLEASLISDKLEQLADSMAAIQQQMQQVSTRLEEPAAGLTASSRPDSEQGGGLMTQKVQQLADGLAAMQLQLQQVSGQLAEAPAVRAASQEPDRELQGGLITDSVQQLADSMVVMQQQLQQVSGRLAEVSDMRAATQEPDSAGLAELRQALTDELAALRGVAVPYVLSHEHSLATADPAWSAARFSVPGGAHQALPACQSTELESCMTAVRAAAAL